MEIVGYILAGSLAYMLGEIAYEYWKETWGGK